MGDVMSSVFVRHLLLSTTVMAGLFSFGARADEAVYQPVEILTLPTKAVCAAEKQGLITQVRTAIQKAADNAQLAARQLARVQADPQANDTTRSAARRERDQRMDAWRSIETALDTAQNLAEKPCPDTAQVSAPSQTGLNLRDSTAPIAPPPVAMAAPVSAATATAFNLAVSLTAPKSCKPGTICALSVDIHNTSPSAVSGPFLLSLTGMGGGAQFKDISPDLWKCSLGSELASCSSSGLSLQPQTRTQMSVNWQVPEKITTPQLKLCARMVWPARGADGVYRTEQIAAVQHGLAQAGFSVGGVSGRLTPKTLEAIGQMRAKSGIQGTAEITPDLLTSLFGANATLAHDSLTSDDQACATLVIEGVAREAVAAAPLVAPVTPTAKKPNVAKAPQKAKNTQRATNEVKIYRSTNRQRPVYEDYDEEDEVVIYRSPRARYGERGVGNARMVYGPDGPILIYPDGRYRRVEQRSTPYYFER